LPPTLLNVVALAPFQVTTKNVSFANRIDGCVTKKKIHKNTAAAAADDDLKRKNPRDYCCSAIEVATSARTHRVRVNVAGESRGKRNLENNHG
jgi:hypothetical protein